MQNLRYNVERGTMMAAAPVQAGLPPLPRRQHRCHLVMSDLVSMSMAAMTIAATGMLIAFI